MSWISKIVFGVIKHDFVATEVTEFNENIRDETLISGTMVHILPDHPGSECYFMIRDYTDWLDEYETAIYKCSNNDCIVVSTELWPYLLAMNKTVRRVQFIEKVYNHEFDMDKLKLGRDIRIRWPTDAKVKYCEFIVTHNGVVPEIGKGFYIGLQSKNKSFSIPAHLKSLSRHYRFGGIGISVPADWVMLNLYKEEENQIEFSATPPALRQTGARPKTRNRSNENLHNNKPNNAKHESNAKGSKMNIAKTDENLTNWLKIPAQLEAIGGSLILVECLLCEEKFEESRIQKCFICFNSVCLECAKLTIVDQLGNGKPTSCPFCKINLNESQISSIRNSRSTVQPQQEISDIDLIQLEMFDVITNSEKTAKLSEERETNPDTCPACFEQLRHRIVLKNCGDVFCKKCLQRTITTQQSNGAVPKCPICTKLIEQDENTCTMFKTLEPVSNSKLIECKSCLQIIESEFGIVLANCGDSLCQYCIMSALFEQFTNSMTPQCPVCYTHITSKEILTLAMDSNILEELDETSSDVALENTKLLQPDTFLVHNDPIKCVACEDGDIFCQNCILNMVREQETEPDVALENPIGLRNICRTPLQQNRQTFECVICENNINSNCGVHLINCGHSWCRDCISEVILQQSENIQIPKCPLCQVEITDEEVSALAPQFHNIFLHNRSDYVRPEFEMPRYDEPHFDVEFGNTRLNVPTREPVEDLIEQLVEINQSPVRHGCEFCYKEIDPECGVVLANCGDSLCHDCVSNAILQQAPNSVTPNCPVCQTQITDDEICALDRGLHDIFIENRLDREDSAERIQLRRNETNHATGTLIEDSPLKCTNCSENINSESGVDVANCGDLWCRNCISNVIVQQIDGGLEPYCLTCEMPFTDEEVITYSSGVFNAFDVYEEGHQNSERNLNPPGMSNEADKCSICLETCQQRVSLINCNHLFCRACIQKWITEQQSQENVPSCPVCREPVELE